MAKPTPQKNTAPGSHWMDASEWNDWLIAQGKPLESADGKEVQKKQKERKKTQNQMNEMLLGAACNGDLRTIKEALEMGADLHARARSGERCTATHLALNHGHDEVAMHLIDAGGLCAPASYGRYSNTGATEFDAAIRSEKGLSDKQKAQAIESTMHIATYYLRHWSSFKHMNNVFKLGHTPEQLLENVVRGGQATRALEAVKEGVEVTTVAWEGLTSPIITPYYNQGLLQSAFRADFLSLMEVPEALKNAHEVTAGLFKVAVATKDTEFFLKLMNAKLKPNDDWQTPTNFRWGNYSLQNRFDLDIDKDGTPEGSIIFLAASSGADSILKMLMNFPTAVEAAKKTTSNPWCFESLNINALIDLMEKGIPIDGVDPEGNGIAHIWAKVDDKPRAGWATLAKKAPAVFALKNNAGKTAMQMMSEKLSTTEKDEFLASLSRIEEREIKKEIAHIPVAKTKPETTTRKRL